MTSTTPLPESLASLTLDTPADTVGGTLNDTDAVRNCLQDAVAFFNDALTDDLRDHITEKWGINDKMINARQIGFTGEGNDVVAHLLNTGYDPLTITRAGVGTAGIIKHIFECGGVSPDNAHVVDTEDLIATDCPHTIPERIDELTAALTRGVIEPVRVDLEAVADYIDTETNEELIVRNWWDKRLVFPYRDTSGEVCYLIGRATEETNDIVYSNGVSDRSDMLVQTVADTELGDSLSHSNDGLRAFILPEYFDGVYTGPDDNKHADAATRVADTITAFKTNSPLPDPVEELTDIGVTHELGTARELSDTTTTRVTILDPSGKKVLPNTDDNTPIVSPVTPGISPGTSIEFVNHTDADVTVSVIGTPSGVWWDDATVAPGESTVKSCGERGMYKYQVTGDGLDRDLHGMVVAYQDVYTDRRNTRIEQWCGDEPNFDVDIAKYVKQTVDRAWVARDAITEPIFGVETVHEGKPLVVTEGVTDAIMAHQHGFPCIAPATTNFKQHHYDRIVEHAADVSAVYVVNDNEVNDAGVNGALRTAKVIENAGYEAKVCELPRPDEADKIDVAEFLKENSKSEFVAVLKDGVRAEEHRKYDAARHDPTHRSVGVSSVSSSGPTDGVGRSSSRSGDVPDGAFDSENTSALYQLELRDVIDFSALDTSRSGNTVYRGENPIRHHGNSTGYFVIRDHGDRVTAKDFKIESSGDGYYYNALTWLATAASCDCSTGGGCSCTRSVTRPMGGLADSEVFWAWKHAKESSHIPVPADDPVPLKAVWWVASQHTVVPDDFIPSSFDDDLRLPATAFNAVLDIIREEYGVNPGRSPR